MSSGSAIAERWCEDHRLPYLGRCPFCDAGVEPVRFTYARRDFAGLPLAGTVDILPHVRTVDLADVVRVCGLQLAEIERRKRELLEPLEHAQQSLYRDMRQANLDVGVFKRAVRVHLGLPGAEAFMVDPAVAACVGCMMAAPVGERRD